MTPSLPKMTVVLSCLQTSRLPMRLCLVICVVLAGVLPAPGGQARAEALPPVDTTLVLAVDASGSLSLHDHHMQRQGYVEAITHPALLHAIRSGRHGRIAVAYLEWASAGRQNIVVPMTVIASRADAEDFARRLAGARHTRLGYTAMGAALDKAARLLVASPYPTDRQVIDLSANGLSNRGPAPHLLRDRLVAAGITINGLPIIADQPVSDALRLESYFTDCVIGGAGAFSLPVTHQSSFVQTLLAKMTHEIAGRIPPMPARILPAAGPVDCWQDHPAD